MKHGGGGGSGGRDLRCSGGQRNCSALSGLFRNPSPPSPARGWVRVTMWAAADALCGVSFLINTAMGGKRPQLSSAPWGPEAGGGDRDPEQGLMKAAPSSLAQTGLAEWPVPTDILAELPLARKPPPILLPPPPREGGALVWSPRPPPTPGDAHSHCPALSRGCGCVWRGEDYRPFGSTSTFLFGPDWGGAGGRGAEEVVTSLGLIGFLEREGRWESSKAT
jgi:hypothetical protein